MNCGNCGAELLSRSAFVTICEKCLLDGAFSGRTAGILQTAQATGSIEAARKGWKPAVLSVAGLGSPYTYSDLMIAGALCMSPATVCGARLHNPDTYELLSDLASRKENRPLPAAVTKLKQTQSDKAQEAGAAREWNAFLLIGSVVVIVSTWAYIIFAGL